MTTPASLATVLGHLRSGLVRFSVPFRLAFMRNVRILMLVMALIAEQEIRAAGVSWPGGGEGAWEASQAEGVKPQLESSFARLSLPADQGGASLSRQFPLEPGRDYELKVDFKSSNQSSGMHHGSWLLIGFADAGGKPLESQHVIFEQAPAWKTKTQRIVPPAGAAQMSLTFRQQQLAGTFDIRKVEISPAAAIAKKPDEPDPFANLVQTERFDLKPDASGKRVLMSSKGTALEPVSADGKLPLSFVLPDAYCEDPKLVYVIDVKFAAGFDGRAATASHGLFTLGRNMSGGNIANSISMILWGGQTYFSRITTANPNARIQAMAAGNIKKSELRQARSIVATSSVDSSFDGKRIGKESTPSDQFLWPKGRPFFIGAEAAGASVFQGEIKEFNITVMRPVFTLELADGYSSAYLTGDRPHAIKLKLDGEIPKTTGLGFQLADADGKETTLPFKVRSGVVTVQLPALPYGTYTFSARRKSGTALGFDFPLAVHPKPSERPPAAESPFAIAPNLPFAGSAGDRAGVERTMELSAKAGIRWTRIWPAWNDLCKVEGQYNWAGLDHMVESATRNGLEIYILFTGGNEPWQTAVKPPSYRVNNGNFPPIDKWREYVRAVAERYKGRVHYYQIWGEEDTRCVFYPYTPEAYLEVLKASHEVLKAVDPTIMVMLGGFCAAFGELERTTHKPTDAFWPAPEFYQLKPGKFFDITCAHFYCTSNTGQSWDPLVQPVKKVVQYLNAIGEGGKPLWNTETSVCASKLNPGGIGGFGNSVLITEKKQAEWLAQWYVQSLAVGIKLNTHYLFADDCSGLVNADFSPKPIYVAHVNLANKLKGMTFAEDLQLGENIRAYLFRSATAGENIIAWTVGGTELLSARALGGSLEVSDLWGNKTDGRPDGVPLPFTLGESPMYLENPKGKLEVRPLIEASCPEFCIAGQTVDVKVTLCNPASKPSQVLVRVASGGGTPKEMALTIAPDAMEKSSFTIDSPVSGAIEYSVKFSGGLDKEFSGSLPCRMRECLDISSGPASLSIAKDSQVVIGKAEYDPQSRLVKESSWNGPSDLSAMATLKQEGNSIAFQIDVTDDKVASCPQGKENQRYLSDCVEVFFDFHPSQPGDHRPIQLAVSPDGQFTAYGETLPNLVITGSTSDHGYLLEGRFDLPPDCGDLFGFNISLNDSDDSLPPQTMMVWVGDKNNAASTKAYGIVRVSPRESAH